LIDDDILSVIEIELADDAWENYVRDDYINELEKHFDIELSVDIDYYELFYKVAERISEYWEAEYNSMCIDTERVAHATTLEELEEYVKKHTV